MLYDMIYTFVTDCSLIPGRKHTAAVWEKEDRIGAWPAKNSSFPILSLQASGASTKETPVPDHPAVSFSAQGKDPAF